MRRVVRSFAAVVVSLAVVVPAALAGIGGALLGRVGPSARPRAPFVLAWFVAVVGLLGIVDAIFPEHRRSLVGALDVTHVHGLSKAVVAPLGFALLAVA